MTQHSCTDAVSELWAASNLEESLVAPRTQCLCSSLTEAATAVLFHTLSWSSAPRKWEDSGVHILQVWQASVAKPGIFTTLKETQKSNQVKNPIHITMLIGGFWSGDQVFYADNFSEWRPHTHSFRSCRSFWSLLMCATSPCHVSDFAQHLFTTQVEVQLLLLLLFP